MNAPGYVQIERPSGYEVTWSSQTASLKEISCRCDEAGCRKVMVFGPSTRVKLSIKEFYKLGKEIGRLHLQVAVVGSHDASSEDTEFLEMVAITRGGSIQFFSNEEDAKKWLRDSG